MKRLNFNIQDSQYEWLSQKSEQLGVSISEIIRRALDHWIQAKDHPFELMRTSDPDYDPLGSPLESKPVAQEFKERFDRIERMLWLALPEEARAEIEEEAKRSAKALGLLKDTDDMKS